MSTWSKDELTKIAEADMPREGAVRSRSANMKLLATTFISLSLFASVSVRAQSIIITRSGSHPSRSGPAETFTGAVRITPLFEAADSSRASGASVSFDPGARTAWHTHPRGQVLIVTAGTGRVQGWGKQIGEIRQGDVVWIPPGLKHWHGASPNTATTHIAIQEHLDGKVVEWMEKVSDEQYGHLPSTSTAARRSPRRCSRRTRDEQQHST